MAKKKTNSVKKLRNGKKLRVRANRLKATGLNKFPIIAHVGTPVSFATGVTATAQGKAKPGQMLLDTSIGKLYFNAGTKQAPTWKQIVLS